jgi:riboflavin synthase
LFTGIVEELGRVRARRSLRLELLAPLVSTDAEVGASIAVNGCCLTVVEHGPDWWAADLSAETLSRTNLGGLQEGDPVNLERPVRVGDRLGGHLVSGHVDAVGVVTAPPPHLAVEIPRELSRYVVEKGSICLDGVSLTVVAVSASALSVSVIPHTAEVTTLGRCRPGARVNVEVDVLAKHVERLLGPRAG